jgi:hypothetical protein
MKMPKVSVCNFYKETMALAVMLRYGRYFYSLEGEKGIGIELWLGPINIEIYWIYGGKK